MQTATNIPDTLAAARPRRRAALTRTAPRCALCGAETYKGASITPAGTFLAWECPRCGSWSPRT